MTRRMRFLLILSSYNCRNGRCGTEGNSAKATIGKVAATGKPESISTAELVSAEVSQARETVFFTFREYLTET